MAEVSPLSWPWYIAGPLLGMFVPLLIIFTGKQLGVSSGFRAFWSIITKRPAYFNYDYKKDVWQIIFGVGVILGALTLYLSGQVPDNIPINEATVQTLKEIGVKDFSGLVPNDIFNYTSWWILILGGILIGFGARLANGCTAGHCIMGISQFSLASILSTVFFFVGGLIATYFIVPILL